MRRRTLLVSLLVSVVGLVLLSVLFTELYYSGAISQAEGQLKIYMNVFEDEYDPAAEANAEAERLSELFGGARITLFSPDGSVLADTQSDTSENHAAREEFTEALESGEGFAVRSSSTLGTNMIYYCRAFPAEGNVQYLARIAVPVSSEVAVFTDAIPTLIWFILVDVLVCLLIAWLATSFILRPVERLTKAAATSGGKEVQTEYSELAPIAKMMNDMNAEINDKMAKMKEDQRLEKLILGSMEHGIVIFRSADDVILINKTAARLLDYEQNEPVRAFTEDREIADILAAREPASVYRKLEGRDYNLRFTFKEQSSVLLITDVTESMAAARSKNDFIANVTHEMNTPLTSIRGFAELIAEGGIPPSAFRGLQRPSSSRATASPTLSAPSSIFPPSIRTSCPTTRWILPNSCAKRSPPSSRSSRRRISRSSWILQTASGSCPAASGSWKFSTTSLPTPSATTRRGAPSP